MVQPASAQDIVDAVRRSFRQEPRLGPDFHLARIEMAGEDVLLVEGEVSGLAQKKLAMLRAAAVPGVAELIDRVHLGGKVPARHIRAQLGDLFARDGDFSGFEVRVDMAEGVLATDFRPVTRISGTPTGRIDIEVNDNLVTLNGVVPALVYKRLAGVLAWRVAGVRDVINGIDVEPPEEDGPDQIEEAVRVALEHNHAVDASQIKAGVRGRTVRLTGVVPSETARALAEDDVWAVLGVNEVINEIEVDPD